MIVVKKINNNVAICLDNNNNELIAFGKGIGFPATPYELCDLSKVQRTFYGVNSLYFNFINEIPENIFEISVKVVDYSKTKIKNEVNSNIVFTLADHINFAIQRYEKKINLKLPFAYDINHLYEAEMSVGEWAVKQIRKDLNINLPENEAVSIALHFINAENIETGTHFVTDESNLILNITEIVEKEFDLHINKLEFNYSRFVSHLKYLLKRKEKEIEVSSENLKLYDSMCKDFPDICICAIHINEYLNKTINLNLNKEELLYLMLHINRLCTREDCYH
ncbi:MAG: PRD domain-containing protein [Clostridium sp.]|uniref:PRD domain-containing protein n=1 Tax=Clostridium sp. TaxID=1506 RepID=UPI002903AABB|nr:PRD domain-containing protein [Clostridium sp.]MDU1586396.1 PRD domain-containing protein [Clostridium sp.]MDU1980108.1 PRD domain-containing protein [Clostridium sp.]MDU1995613.1 PRD domain-containing protein [Clostridium sp.]MDU6050075.1 PRD domain-containing protein [Clostridium sp.]MDU6223746.1 PRD domain-containing protein [Clostridium sp.]